MAVKFTRDELEVDEDSNNAIGLLIHSRPWLEATTTLLKKSKDQHFPGFEYLSPTIFLVLHSLECSLKAFLRARGISQKNLDRKHLVIE